MIKNKFLANSSLPFSAILLEMDGVLFHGMNPIDGAIDFMQRIEHIPHVYITNNPIRLPESMADKKANNILIASLDNNRFFRLIRYCICINCWRLSCIMAIKSLLSGLLAAGLNTMLWIPMVCKHVSVSGKGSLKILIDRMRKNDRGIDSLWIVLVCSRLETSTKTTAKRQYNRSLKWHDEGWSLERGWCIETHGSKFKKEHNME